MEGQPRSSASSICFSVLFLLVLGAFTGVDPARADTLAGAAYGGSPAVADHYTPNLFPGEPGLLPGRERRLHGRVEGNGNPQPGYRVSLYVSYAGRDYAKVLATTRTDSYGKFRLRYRQPFGLSLKLRPVYFVIADRGPAMLASAIGTGPRVPGSVVVNERTTVATGTAFAQFIKGRQITGNLHGMLNAVHMAANMANPESGELAAVLASPPNGTDTETLRTFNSLANVVASCVADPGNCLALFSATSRPGEPPSRTVVQALANATRFPAYPNYPRIADDPLFLLSLASPIYQPTRRARPTSWLLFLKFTGGQYSAQDSDNLINGPGNIAIDRRGFAWINDNYVPAKPDEFACAGQRLLKFYPWGETFPGVPYFGGGLSGAGFGITLDPRGNVWVGNFGFEAAACADGTVPPDPRDKIPATHNSVSLFHPSGTPLSPFRGFTRGDIFWPQATVSDHEGNIWVANCGNDSVTIIPRGNPARARNIPLPGGGTEPDSDSPLLKPFAIAIDPRGRAWVTGNKAQQVYIVSLDGSVEPVRTSQAVLSWPMGISGDSRGNMWVSSSDTVNIVCIDPLDSQGGANPSIVFFPADGGEPQQFAGTGGLTIPWGNAVDGDDTVWVFNFGRVPLESADDDQVWPDTGVSRFCGSGNCPHGLELGDPISPDTGYTSDALERVTGGAVDPSGNLWLLNNWRKDGPLFYSTNPGGNSFVIVPGAAKPVKTPLIGPPRSFAASHLTVKQ
ncbi:hypothetical protein [Microbulbifer yueqingensis]|uniref:NHL repeat-containing protein n=1 Tax=Microbulbifer yueqingensis TaxID=658219 RepID=A0A1G9AUS6_9GAMM|nr:hypothetical protein [Microbulbifer yueqingensis]SDK30420.1 hypothetical protein SAMN05216212_2149 [Microbulbifer yueqingensis]